MSWCTDLPATLLGLSRQLLGKECCVTRCATLSLLIS